MKIVGPSGTVNKPPDPEFWAWLAGFWEGEGSFAKASQHNGESYFRLSIYQNDPSALHEIQRVLGGYIHRYKKVHEWRLNDFRQILEIAERLLPYVRTVSRHHLMKTTLASMRNKILVRHKWHWTEREKAKLAELWLSHRTSCIAKQLCSIGPYRVNFTVWQVRSMGHFLGLPRRDLGWKAGHLCRCEP